MIDNIPMLSSAIDVLPLLADVPDVNPEQPPGTDGILTFLNWISWGAIIAGVAGFIISAGALAFAALTGREFNHAKGLALSILACVLVASVGGILQVFV